MTLEREVMSDKEKFLENFIKIAAEKGVSDLVMFEASKSTYGHERGYVLDFYRGLEEVIQTIEEKEDLGLKGNKNISTTTSVTQKVKIAIESRIAKEGINFDFTKKLLEYYQTPAGLKLYMKTSWATCDYIWSIVGDQSFDWNYYSKRLILFKIYTKIRNKYFYKFKGDLEKTQYELDKSLDRVKIFNKLKQKFKLENLPFIRLLVK